jgi:hypothetical protein
VNTVVKLLLPAAVDTAAVQCRLTAPINQPEMQLLPHKGEVAFVASDFTRILLVAPFTTAGIATDSFHWKHIYGLKKRPRFIIK